MRNPQIVFFGTPAFAAAQLQALAEAQCNIAAVVTAPDRPAGRGLQPQSSAVKVLAKKYNLPTLQPENLREPAFLAALRKFNADIFVVVAFRMLPQEVWQMPPLGTFNLHASLLPQYRGAAPINWAIINGETETGITTFLLDHHIDTGGILLQEAVPVSTQDTAAALHDKLMRRAGALILHTIDGLRKGTLAPKPQPSANNLKTAPKLHRRNTCIDPMSNANDAANLVRGLSPVPAAWIEVQINGAPPQMLKVYAAQPDTNAHDNTFPVGSVIREKDALLVRCCNGYLRITEVQMQGKKRMPTADFLRGLRGDIRCAQ